MTSRARPKLYPKMKRWGFCPDRLRIKWRCPLAAAKKTPPITSCPHFANGCSNSPYGRVIYTYSQENYRLHTLIPRDSDLWLCHQDARSCAERSVKREKYDFHLLQTRTAAGTAGSSASCWLPCASTSMPG